MYTSTLTLSIDISLRGTFAKSLSHHTHISDEIFLVFGKQFRDDQFIWLMQWSYCEIREAKEDMVRVNPVGARSLKGLGALGRLGLEGLLLFVYPNFIL